MQTRFELRREHHIDGPLQLNSAKPFKSFGNNMHSVVCLAFRGRTCMPGMFGAIINDFKQFRLEGLL